MENHSGVINNEIELELKRITRAYEKRTAEVPDHYSPLSPAELMIRHEKERAILRWIRKSNILPLSDKTLLEIGCGDGSNLLLFLKLGFKPENIVANELLSNRAEKAREILPAKTEVLCCSALDLEFAAEYFDIVYQSLVFSSILNENFRQELAAKMWKFIKPGGGVLWYDFTVDNPFNKDVKGIPLREIKNLFPSGKIKSWRITLAPPISRFVTKLHHSLYSITSSIFLLRTHLLCWIEKH
jgi:SAM-dependent methyltransferase